MVESILTSIKQRLGPEGDYDAFESDILMEINTAFFDLNRIGVGPSEGFHIEDDSAVWSDFIPETSESVVKEALKTYIYLRVKLIFDTPDSNAHIEVINRRIKELEWSLREAVEYTQ